MRRVLGWVLAAFCLLSTAAQAGRPCAAARPQVAAFMQAMTLAERTYSTLDSAGAQLVLIARVGQDLSQYGVRYSHLAYALRDHPQGRWLVVHELNQCGTAQSALFNEGLGNFFLDDMFAYETRILVPGPEVQRRLVAMLSSGQPLRLHGARYNMLAYAFGTAYQNSNQWVLETFAAGMAEMPVSSREQAQAWLKLAGYAPITVQVPALTRLGARMFKANVAFDDHPFERRMAGQIDTVTVESVLRFVHQRDPSARDIVIAL